MIKHTNNALLLACCRHARLAEEDLITTEKRAAWCFMEKRVSWRVLSGLSSYWPDGRGRKATLHDGETRFVH